MRRSERRAPRTPSPPATMSADQTTDALTRLDALGLIDGLKKQARLLYEASCEIDDALSAAEQALLDDDVDQTTAYAPPCHRALIVAQLATVESMVDKAEDAVLDSRDLLAG